MTLSPSPADCRQAVCASYLAHLLICGEHSRARSSSNLTSQTRCLPGCSGCGGHLIPGAEPQHRAVGERRQQLDARAAGQRASSKAGLTPFLSESPAWVHLQLVEVMQREQNSISSETKRSCCSDLSNYLPLYFHIIISE